MKAVFKAEQINWLIRVIRFGRVRSFLCYRIFSQAIVTPQSPAITVCFKTYFLLFIYLFINERLGRKGYDDDGDLLCNQRLLQEYILLCSQSAGGGLRDKPSKFVSAFNSNLLIIFTLFIIILNYNTNDDNNPK
jgi:hypothetical protein